MLESDGVVITHAHGTLCEIINLGESLPLGIYSTFSHSDETAMAGYYSVRLQDYDIRVSLTATPRCGIQRYEFPENGKERVHTF